MNNNLTVIKSNDLVQASYSLTLDERRLIDCAIAKIKSGEPVPDKIIITAEDYSEAWDIHPKTAYRQLKKSVLGLYHKDIFLFKKWNNDEAKGKTSKYKEGYHYRWVDSCAYKEDCGHVALSFTKWVKPYLEQLKANYTSYGLLEIGGLKSANAIRLYELLMQYKSTGYKIDTVENLKMYFGVENKNMVWADFNRYILKPSAKKVVDKTNFTLTYRPVKVGRKVVSVEFFFSHVQQTKLI